MNDPSKNDMIPLLESKKWFVIGVIQVTFTEMLVILKKNTEGE